MIKLIINIAEGILVFLVLFILKLMGKKVASNVCSYLFIKIGPLTKFNKVAVKNIKYVWPNLSNHKTKLIINGMWNNIGRNFGEFVHLKTYNPLSSKNTKIIGLKKLHKINSNKKGIIFFSAHYGNWELGPIIIKKLGFEPLCIYRKSNNKFIEILIQKIRATNANYAPKGDIGAKKSYLWLRKGKNLALLMDQKLNEGPYIPFLGKPAPTANFIAELCLRMNLDIIPVKLERTDNYNHIITFSDKLKMPSKKLSHSEKVKYILENINTVISKWIAERPEQWLWIHRRWPKKMYK